MRPATQAERERGWALAPARLPRADVAKLRRLYHAAHAASPQPHWLPNPIVDTVLHAVDRDDPLRLALAKLGASAAGVLVTAQAGDSAGNSITVNVSVFMGENVGDRRVEVAIHRFRRTTPISEWTRILGRHCRHALGVLAHLRVPTLATIFSGASKVP